MIEKKRTSRITRLCMIALLLPACHAARTTVTPATNPPPPVTTPNLDFQFVKPPDGIKAPGDEELRAIQVQYRDVSMQQLEQGHAIYIEGACTHCHGPQGIYQYDAVTWKNIVDDMASRAGISAEEKDAVYKYVLSIKATQPR